MKQAILANKVRLKLLNKLFLVAAFLLLLQLELNHNSRRQYSLKIPEKYYHQR